MDRYESPADIPVILITYNRPQHTEQVINALRLHGVTNLTIYSDAPKHEAHQAGVEETRALFNGIDWTCPEIIIQSENQGLANSIRVAVDGIFQKEDFVILLEDDCVPERFFMRFMYDCYQRYKNDPKVFGVSGYTVAHQEHVLDSYEPDLYFVPRIGSWGWGTWKEKWALHERDLHSLLEQCVAGEVDLSQGGSDIPHLINGLMTGEVQDVWTLHWILSVYLQKGFYIYPTRSHVQNIGMDGSGVHCGPTDKFVTPIATERPTVYPESVVLNRALYSSFRSFYDVDGENSHDESFLRLERGLEDGGEGARGREGAAAGIGGSQESRIKVLNIIDGVEGGEALQSVAGAAKYLKEYGSYQSYIIGLNSAVDLSRLSKEGMTCLQESGAEQIRNLISEYDIVFVHWSNSKEMNDFLATGFPSCRLIIWGYVGEEKETRIVTDDLLNLPDFFIGASPISNRSEAICRLSAEARRKKIGMVYAAPDFDVLENLKSVDRKSFNVGYIGNINSQNIHSSFVDLCARVQIPNVQFILAGDGDAVGPLKQQAIEAGISERIIFKEQSENTSSELGTFDLFACPLSEENGSVSEMALQQALYSGIPAVVFPHGGVRDLVIDQFTGLVVKSEQEFVDAIEYLYHNPDQRERLGRNAKDYAQQIFGAKNAARKLDGYFQRILSIEKSAKNSTRL